MERHSPQGAGAVGGLLPEPLPLAGVDAALAMAAYAANQVIAGQVTLAHFLGGLVRAHASELSAAGAQAMPAARAAVASIAELESRFADEVIDAANRYGRRFAHLAFAFPLPRRGVY